MHITQNARTADFILSLANGTLSLENAILASGAKAQAGTVLGQITASGKYVPLAPAAEDGSETAAGVLYALTDATDADQACVVVARQAELKIDGLIWPDAIAPNDKTAAIAALNDRGIFLR